MNSEMWLRHCSSPGDRNLYDFGSSGPSIAEHAIKPVFLIDSCCSIADDGPFSATNTIPVKKWTVTPATQAAEVDVMAESTVRRRFDDSLGVVEMGIYSVLAVLLSLTILAALASACKLLLDSVIHWTVATQTLRVLNELLIVLMLAEILHTVRISIRSHVLVTEPFLVVGLIASIRRILVISLEMATLGRELVWTSDSTQVFRSSMIELGLLGLLVLVLVFSITLLRRYPANVKDA
jgi:Phosphate-starvation-inducible E family